MKKYSEAFVGFDTAKKKHAVAIADAGRDGEAEASLAEISAIEQAAQGRLPSAAYGTAGLPQLRKCPVRRGT
jgi:hypothetical protein